MRLTARLAPLAAVVAALSLSSFASAAPYAPVDVRSAAMGGTGVASARAGSAARFNPALLSAQAEGDHVQVVLGFGVVAADEDEFIDQADGLADTVDAIDQTIDDVNNLVLATNTAAAELAGVATNMDKLSNQLTAINGDALRLRGDGNLGFGKAGKMLGIGAFVAADVQAAGAPVINAADTATLNAYADLLDGGKITLAEFKQAKKDGIITGSKADIDLADFDPLSQGNVVILMSTEIGVGLSKQLDDVAGGRLAVGVTPKIVSMTAYDYIDTFDNFDGDNVDGPASETSEDAFDLDVGAVYSLGEESPWQVGVAVKNLAGHSIDTALGRSIDIDPQVRVGAARMAENITFTADLDLTENDGLAFGDETQFLALGGEFSFAFVDLRAGYRTNLADSDVSDLLSAGIGLGPVEFFVAGSDGEIGGGLQFAMGF